MKFLPVLAVLLIALSADTALAQNWQRVAHDEAGVSGPNAIISEINLESTGPTPPGPAIEDVAKLVDARVRFTARPADFVSLNGQWSFCADGLDGADWKPIEVPGEWAMQGFTVKPGQAAGYKRVFTAPRDRAGKRIILRFEGVYSESTVLLNGREIGRHLGGFTPFEFDVTGALKDGENVLALAVENESLADTMANGSKYAEHPLGGITRKAQLFAVPDVHIAGLEVTGTPDETLSKGTAHVVFEVVNASKETARNVSITASVTPSGAHATSTVASIAPGTGTEAALDVPVEKPALWDNEHPNLSTLRLSLSTGETIEQSFGFRRIEVRGNQLFVNNQPVKLRGACYHQTHPTLGRSLTPGYWHQDAELFRDANLNLIRTSHYPPPEEFLDACDRLGLFVECEAPLCWANQTNTDAANYVLSANMESVQWNRNHPCVLFWSLANESHWSPSYQRAAQMVKALDPSRPRDFNNTHRADPTESGYCEIENVHYPGPGGPGKYGNAAHPEYFGEYCHLELYNRFEIAADPGLRDSWGQGFRRMWDAMFASQGTLGGSIWAAMDDTFELPNGQTVGYGAWGLVDNWRRPKPEYWHVKKTYSPVRIDESRHNLPVGATIELPVLNQANFSNLREFDIRWAIGNEQGKVVADIAPHQKGMLRITPERAPVAGDLLKIEIHDPRGFLADEYAFTFGEDKPSQTTGPVVPTSITAGNGAVLLTAGQKTLTLASATGLLSSSFSGPTLMVLPLNGKGSKQMDGVYFSPPDNQTATGWKLSSLKVLPDTVTASGEYAEAKGAFTYALEKDGVLRISYRFTVTQNVNPRQVGLVFDLPRAWDTLSWQRNAPYMVYPDDHIGRPAGSARAFGAKDRYEPVNLRQKPTWPWSQDASEGGTNDFRATRENIFWCRLADSQGHGIRVLSDGRQHARAWVDGDRVRLLIADYSNAGDPPFFRPHTGYERRPLKAGAVIEGTIRIRF